MASPRSLLIVVVILGSLVQASHSRAAQLVSSAEIIARVTSTCSISTGAPPNQSEAGEIVRSAGSGANSSFAVMVAIECNGPSSSITFRSQYGSLKGSANNAVPYLVQMTGGGLTGFPAQSAANGLASPVTIAVLQAASITNGSLRITPQNPSPSNPVPIVSDTYRDTITLSVSQP